MCTEKKFIYDRIKRINRYNAIRGTEPFQCIRFCRDKFTYTMSVRHRGYNIVFEKKIKKYFYIHIIIFRNLLNYIININDSLR